MKQLNDKMLLAFVLLLREKFYWVNDIVVYDRALPRLERELMKALNCSLLCPSKHGNWSVDKPTLFFMPRSQMFEFVSIVEANWSPAMLINIIILGDSFKDFTQQSTSISIRESNTIMRNEQILHEMALPEKPIEIPCVDNQHEGSTEPNEDFTNDDIRAFNGLSWHLFYWNRLFDDVNPQDVRTFFGWDSLPCFNKTLDFGDMHNPSYYHL